MAHQKTPRRATPEARGTGAPVDDDPSGNISQAPKPTAPTANATVLVMTRVGPVDAASRPSPSEILSSLQCSRTTLLRSSA